VRVVRRDGSAMHADLRFDAVRDASGRTTEHMVTVRDASDRRRVDELRARWELLFRATSRGIAVTDPATGLLEAVNPAWAAMHGGAEADFVGKPVTVALSEASAARLPVLTAPLLPGEMIAYESEHVRLDGTTFPAAIELMATVDGLGHEPRWLTWVDDLSARRRAESDAERHAADLVRSNADLDRFAAVVTHDLQAPLRVIVGCARILERRAGERLAEDERRLVEMIAGGARRMAALVEGIRAYSGVRGAETIEDALSLQSVVDDVVPGMREDLEEAGATIAVGALPTVPGDRVALTQLVQNLLGNALKFRGEAPPVIAIDAERAEGGDWVVTVADNGIGIAPEYAERVFGFGDRLHTHDDIAGTGIGLAVCKTVVERHGGRIWVEPAHGGGSAFRFTLPPAPR